MSNINEQSIYQIAKDLTLRVYNNPSFPSIKPYHEKSSLMEYCISYQLLAFKFIREENYIDAFNILKMISETIIHNLEKAAKDFSPELFQIIITTFGFVSQLIDEKVEKKYIDKYFEDYSRILGQFSSQLSRTENYYFRLITDIKWIKYNFYTSPKILKVRFNGILDYIDKLEHCPLSQYVTYYFYYGKYELYLGNHSTLCIKASSYLTRAYENCIHSSSKNKRTILYYLVISKMLCGVLPSVDILLKYNMSELVNITIALKTGNLNKFNECMKENSLEFQKKGVYLSLMKLKLFFYRRIIKRVFLIKPNSAQDKPFIYLKDLQKAFSVSGMDVTQEDLAYLLCNLTDKRLLRGYVSNRGVLILANKPFPKLTVRW